MTEIARDIIDLYSEKAQLEEKEIADYEVMLQLLCGYRVESGRQLPAKYPVKNSGEELRAKTAFAQYINRKIWVLFFLVFACPRYRSGNATSSRNEKNAGCEIRKSKVRQQY